MTAPLNIDKARLETPACSSVVHLNSAGASLMPSSVAKTVREYLDCEMRMGGYEAAEYAGDAQERVYASIANLLTCDPSEIALTENATRAWNMALFSITFNRGDRILTSQSEYIANRIAFTLLAQRTGVNVEEIPNDSLGRVCLESLDRALDDRVKLVAITHAPNNSGLVQPISEIGTILLNSRALYMVDACQSVGQMPVSVQDIGCDLLSFTGRKYLRGPRGTGCLYVSGTVVQELNPPFLEELSTTRSGDRELIIRPDARRFETWEANVAGRLGLGAAVEYALGWGLGAIQQRIDAVASQIRERLRALKQVKLVHIGEQQSGIVTFEVAGRSAEQVKLALRDKRINVGVVRHPLGLANPDAPMVVRASPHYYNTEEEVDILCKAVA